ncbi:MAG: hypothetical protein CMA59_00420 [Euryarchaeota archaeon]|nr:hypothetical protein [Euryarchaeota archaeon]
MAKNTHLEHIEDDILNDGTTGGHNAVAFLKELGKMLSEPKSSITVTTKWDGAPAVVCGIDPEDDLFFVGTKSVFNKTGAKLIKTQSDISFHGYSGELAKKLSICLELLPKLNIKGVIQGDLLFTNGDKSSKKIDGKDCIAFTPNTITYCVEKGSDIYKEVSAATVGIVFHTKYQGSDLGSMNALLGDVSGSFTKDPAVFAGTATLKDVSKQSTFTPGEQTKFEAQVSKTVGSLKQSSKFLDTLKGTGDGRFLFSALFKQYFNSYIRGGKTITNAMQVATGFNGFYVAIMDKQIASVKTENTKKKYQKIKADGLKFLKVNSRAVYMTVASYMNIVAAKKMVIAKLNGVKSVGTYLKTDTGFKVTAPEGFVAIKSGKALKLVDRLEFSRANFTAAKSWR